MPLLLELLDDGIQACGTLRSNRVGFPPDLSTSVKKGLQSRGDFIVRQCCLSKSSTFNCSKELSNQLAVSLWQDNRPVVVASTNCDPSKSTEVQRRQRDGNRVSVSCPLAVSLYNKYMGGIDHNDQLRGYYSVRSKGRKGYKYIWWFLFDLALTNMFILAKHHSSQTQTVKSVKDFRTNLAQSLIGDYSSRKRRGRPVTSSIPSRRFCDDHFPRRAEKKGRCHLCYHDKHERHESYWFCPTCKKHLCHNGNVNDCFLIYHRK